MQRCYHAKTAYRQNHKKRAKRVRKKEQKTLSCPRCTLKNKEDALRPQYMSKSSHSGNDRAINKHGQCVRFTSRAFHSKQKIHHSTL